MIVDTSKLSKQASFPIVRAVKESRTKGIWESLHRFFTYRRRWEVMVDYIIWSESMGVFIFIPKGFIFDGASIPKPLHGLMGPTGMLLLGAGPHDFGYQYKGLLTVESNTGQVDFTQYSKNAIDNMFKYLCRLESGFYSSAWIAKKVVEYFGDSHWDNNDYDVLSICRDFPEIISYKDI